jgi:chorismate mutase
MIMKPKSKQTDLKKLKQKRTQIDKLDHKILQLIEKRFSIAESIALIKAENQLKSHDPQREQEILNHLFTKKPSDKAQKYFIPIFKTILKHSRSRIAEILKTLQ